MARLDAGQAAQIYEIRAMLEALAARAAAERATPADIKALTKANADIQAAFAGGHGRDIVKATSDWYELMFRIADKPMAWQVVQGLNAPHQPAPRRDGVAARAGRRRRSRKWSASSARSRPVTAKPPRRRASPTSTA